MYFSHRHTCLNLIKYLTAICVFKIGIPEEQCIKLLGTHWEVKVSLDGKKCYDNLICYEYSEYNMCRIWQMGIELELADMPGFGGKVCFYLPVCFL